MPWTWARIISQRLLSLLMNQLIACNCSGDSHSTVG
uniref:Uncharacterized protein n=1 Tax=Arundo donax TaxID=35708 RepID=A0A0A8Y6E4_ARUDO